MRLPEVPANNRFRVLIVEDDPSIAKLVSVHVKMAKFDPFVAINGLDGWSQFTQIDPHLILTDINMPGLSGHELVEKVRATSMVPILMMTAADSEQYQMKGFKVGADDYIPKPFNPQILMVRIIANLRRVYRYDSGGTGSQTSKSNARDDSNDPPSMGLPAGWAKCEACSYLGPVAKFQTRNGSGDKVVQCPNCSNKNLTFSIE